MELLFKGSFLLGLILGGYAALRAEYSWRTQRKKPVFCSICDRCIVTRKHVHIDKDDYISGMSWTGDD